MVPVCLFLLPLFVWQTQLLLAGMGVNGPDAFLVSLLVGLLASSVSLLGVGTSVKSPSSSSVDTSRNRTSRIATFHVHS